MVVATTGLSAWSVQSAQGTVPPALAVGRSGCAEAVNSDKGVSGAASAAVFDGNQAKLNVAVDLASQVMYISDVEWVRLVHLSSDLATPSPDYIVTIAGKPGTSPDDAVGELSDGPATDKDIYVLGMTVDSGVVYLADGSLTAAGKPGGLRIRTLTRGGPTGWTLSTIATDPDDNSYRAHGLAIAGGKIYVAQPERHQIGVVNGTKIDRLIADDGRPESVAADAAGRVFVTTDVQPGVYEIVGSTKKPVAGPTNGYSGITTNKRVAVDPQGTTLFVSDQRTLYQVDLERDPNTVQVVAGATKEDKVTVESLFYRGGSSPLFIGSGCVIRTADPLRPQATTTTKPADDVTKTGTGKETSPGTPNTGSGVGTTGSAGNSSTGASSGTGTPAGDSGTASSAAGGSHDGGVTATGAANDGNVASAVTNTPAQSVQPSGLAAVGVGPAPGSGAGFGPTVSGVVPAGPRRPGGPPKRPM